jgi:hypothetical protein
MRVLLEGAEGQNLVRNLSASSFVFKHTEIKMCVIVICLLFLWV